MNRPLSKKRVKNELKAILIELAHEFKVQQSKYVAEHKLSTRLKMGAGYPQAG